MASARVKEEIKRARLAGRARKLSRQGNKRGSVGCRIWTGYIKPCDSGQDWYEYGIIRVAGTNKLAHRVLWELANGPVPEGRRLRNTCGDTRCVTPAHWTVREPKSSAA